MDFIFTAYTTNTRMKDGEPAVVQDGLFDFSPARTRAGFRQCGPGRPSPS